MADLLILVLAGALIIDVLWEWLGGVDADLEAEEQQRSLMQEIRRHD